jgi:hypothetical protein
MRHVLFALLIACTAARAEVVFEKPVQEHYKMPDDGHLEAHFKFKNTGPGDVTIKRVKRSCGCTTAKLDKETYAPGESGDIVVKSVFGLRRGPQRKILSVMSEDKHEWRLDLRCWIGEPIRLSPALVYWKTGEAPETKDIKIAVPEGQVIKVRGVSSSDAKFSAKLETVKEGSSYLVHVKPVSTAEKASVELSIDTDYPPEAPRSYRAFVRVK